MVDNILLTNEKRGILVASLLTCWTDIIVSEFELQSCYYVHFRLNIIEKDTNPLILLAMSQIVPPQFLDEDSFDMK